jgi:hypothetical protein
LFSFFWDKIQSRGHRPRKMKFFVGAHQN